MSAENVALVRKSYERDAQSFGPDWATIAPEFEYHTLSTEPEASRIRGKGRGSGLEIDAPYVLVWKVKDGLRVECREYSATDEALEALGLVKPG
jgi:ketosteroid isomerase-like protein